MKIISCHIENYGKLTKKNFYFDSDIASFNWENGAGKTTLASFIKAMFYGIPSVKANTKSFEDRQHFYPFDKGSFGGSIVFELNGTEFKIERFFDKKSSVKDEVKVYKNGGLTDELGDDIGKSVFGIDKESFEKTVFFNAEDIEIYTPAGIEAKIQNSDEGSTAKKLLEEEIKKLQPQRGKNGLIPNQQELVRTLREEAYRLESIQERTQTLYERREQIKEEIKEKEEEIKKSLVLESKLEEYVVPANKEREFAALSDMFITGVPQKSDFERINKCFDEFKELDEKDSQLKEQQQQILNKAKMNKLLLTVEAFLIITAAVLLGVGQIIGAVVTVGMAGILAVYLMEAITSIFMDKFKMKRVPAVIAVTIISILLGIPSSMGNGAWAHITILGMDFLTFFDFISNSVIMPIVALLTCILIGWFVGTKTVEDEVTVNGEKFGRVKIFRVMAKYIAPVCLVVILVFYTLVQFGVIAY